MADFVSHRPENRQFLLERGMFFPYSTAMTPMEKNGITDGTTRPLPLRGSLRARMAGITDIVKNAVENFQENGDANQAAAISLYAILSFIPLFILTLVAVTYIFGAHTEIRQEIFAGIQRLNPYLSDSIIAQMGGIEEKQQVLGWLGIITLVWFSAMIFSSLETALNIVFRSRVHRSYLKSKALAIAMIPTAWGVGVASFLLSTIASLVISNPVLSHLPVFKDIQGALFRYLIPYTVTVLYFAIVYRVVPTVRIPLRVAIAGSALFSALMEAAKHLFTWYVTKYSRYNIIFGSLEAVVLLVIFVFYVALILLFCAELMSSYLRRDLILLENAFFRKGGGGLATAERLYRKFGRTFPAGTYVFHEGDVGREMFYILSGRIGIEKQAGWGKKLLMELSAGQYFGEMAALIDAPRTAYARALEDSALAVIDRETVQSLLRESEGVSLLMLKEFSRRIKATNEALEEMTRSRVRIMVIVHFLKEWSPSDSSDAAGELARYAGIDREEVMETIAELVGEGILTEHHGTIRVYDPDKAWEAVVRSLPKSSSDRS
ncbi:MAG: YihY family inner membrane protein [Syntrophales bacterium]|nr:YihY family inner membrane protein [Syntrophales bacterium]